MKKEEISEEAKERARISEHWYSFILFEWLNPNLKKGRQGTLTDKDMLNLALKDCSAALETKFQPYLDAVAAYRCSPETAKKPNLMYHLWWISKRLLVRDTLAMSLTSSTILLRPLLVREMILFVQDKDGYSPQFGVNQNTSLLSFCFLMSLSLLSVRLVRNKCKLNLK